MQYIINYMQNQILQFPISLTFQTLEKLASQSYKIYTNKPFSQTQLQQKKILDPIHTFSHQCYSTDFIKTFLAIKINSLLHPNSNVNSKIISDLIQLFNQNNFSNIYESHSDNEFMYQILKNGLKISQVNENEYDDLMIGNCLATTILFQVTNKTKKIINLSEIAFSLTFQVFNGRLNAFLPIIHQQKNHIGQIQCAKNIMKYIGHQNKASPFNIKRSEEHTRVQDSYSIRCTPQVHGLAYDMVKLAQSKVLEEINSFHLSQIKIDNELFPICHTSQNLIHLFDQLVLSIHEISNISLVRSERMINKYLNKLPFDVSKDSNFNNNQIKSVFQYCSEILIQNKTLCTPISLDSITANNYEDDVNNYVGLIYKKYVKMWKHFLMILGLELVLSSQCLKKLQQKYTESILQTLQIQHKKIEQHFENIFEKNGFQKFEQRIQKYFDCCC